MSKGVLRLYLIRHGETDFNRAGIFQGHSELPINDLGIHQASLLAERLAGFPIEKIYSSDVRRAAMTAVVAAARIRRPLIFEPLWRERDPGDLVGRPYSEAMEFFSDPKFMPQDGESRDMLDARIGKAIDRLTQLEAEGMNDGIRHIAVVTHGMALGGFARVALRLGHEGLEGYRWPNTSLTIADYEGAWKASLMADDSHLTDDERLGNAQLSGA